MFWVTVHFELVPEISRAFFDCALQVLLHKNGSNPKLKEFIQVIPTQVIVAATRDLPSDCVSFQLFIFFAFGLSYPPRSAFYFPRRTR